MSIIRWIVKHKLLLVAIYAVINVLLHIPLFFMEANPRLAELTAWVDYPSGIIYFSILEKLLSLSVDLHIAVQGLFSVITNSLIILGLLTLLGKASNVNPKPEIAKL